MTIMTKKSFVIIMAAVYTLSVAINVLFGISTIKSKNAEKTALIADVLTTGIYNAVEGELSKPIQTSLIMANDIFLKDSLKNENTMTEAEAVSLMADYLTQIKDVLGADTAFVISEGTGRYYSYSGLNKIIDVENDPHDVWYSIFVNGHKPYDIDIDVDEVNGGRWTVFLNARIEDEDGSLIGVCGVGVTMTEFQEILKTYEQDYSLKVSIVNHDGLVQLDTDSINIENAYLFEAQNGREHDGYTFTDENGNCVSMRYINNVDMYLVVRFIPTDTSAEYIPLIIRGICFVLIIPLLHFVLRKKIHE